MGIVVFVLLTLGAVVAIAYPLLPGKGPAPEARAVTDGEIDRAVKNLRRTRRQDGLRCPGCGKGYQPGDRFCVRCGGALSQTEVAAQEPACPSCGAMLQEEDRFCSKCGHDMGNRETAS